MNIEYGKGFSKISKPTERDGAYHLKFGFLFTIDCFPLMRDWNWDTNGKEISYVLF